MQQPAQNRLIFRQNFSQSLLQQAVAAELAGMSPAESCDGGGTRLELVE
jgi:hypothetical protein